MPCSEQIIGSQIPDGESKPRQSQYSVGPARHWPGFWGSGSKNELKNWQSFLSGAVGQGSDNHPVPAWALRGSRERKEARMGIARVKVVKRTESCILSGKGRYLRDNKRVL